MPPRILRITKNEPHGETVTEIELPDDARVHDPRYAYGDVTPSLTVIAHTRSVETGSCVGFHQQVVDLTGVTAISIEAPEQTP
jgi:hypothetical protein